MQYININWLMFCASSLPWFHVFHSSPLFWINYQPMKWCSPLSCCPVHCLHSSQGCVLILSILHPGMPLPRPRCLWIFHTFLHVCLLSCTLRFVPVCEGPLCCIFYLLHFLNTSPVHLCWCLPLLLQGWCSRVLGWRLCRWMEPKSKIHLPK